MPAVVTIQTPTSRGSGFFVAPDTLITNVHVVGTESTVTIRRSNGTTTTARVQATSPAFDIAVLKVSDVVPNQTIIPLGATASVRIGEEVIAIGTPLGFLQNTVSRGIVSGLRDVGGATLVQTDAAINPGNSGGPLLNRNGAVIGIIKSGYVGSDGLAFAVAIDHARAVLAGRGDPVGRTGGIARSIRRCRPRSPRRPTSAASTRHARTKRRSVNWRGAPTTSTASGSRSSPSATRAALSAPSIDRGLRCGITRAMLGVVASGCTPYFDDLRRRATEIQRAVTAVDEVAREADIYPGTRRDVLRKYRLDYAGWSRLGAGGRERLDRAQARPA